MNNSEEKISRICKIEVRKLFGIFDHVIPIPTDERIKIITGPNGYGKTIILSMINGLFARNYSVFWSVPFDQFNIEFENGDRLQLSREVLPTTRRLKEDKTSYEIVISYFSKVNPKKTLPPYILQSIDQLEVTFPLEMVDEIIPELTRNGPNRWTDMNTDETLTLYEVVTRYGDRIPSRFTEPNKIISEPDWFTSLKERLNVRFIQTERLRGYNPVRSRRRRFEEDDRLAFSVTKYSRELARSLQEKLAQYGSFSQSLDRSLPTRLLNHEYLTEIADKDIKERWDKLEKTREELIDNGLLPKEENPFDSRALENMDEMDRRILSVYVKDIESKLNVFIDLNVKIKLFLKIVNSKFLHKKMFIDSEQGFLFKVSEQEILPSFRLSSGEQHEIVMLYELLFKVPSNSLILIDEPELSLHVFWQQKFLEDLNEITSISNFDVLIATHSPEIIQNRWDLAVELKGPGDD